MSQGGVAKRSVVINGRKTSVSVEEPFWKALRDIAKDRRVTLIDLVSEIEKSRKAGSLSSSIRVWVMEHFRSVSRGVGHALACLALMFGADLGGSL